MVIHKFLFGMVYVSLGKLYKKGSDFSFYLYKYKIFTNRVSAPDRYYIHTIFYMSLFGMMVDWQRMPLGIKSAICNFFSYFVLLHERYYVEINECLYSKNVYSKMYSWSSWKKAIYISRRVCVNVSMYNMSTASQPCRAWPVMYYHCQEGAGILIYIVTIQQCWSNVNCN